MRSYQVMRYGRRITPTPKELAQSVSPILSKHQTSLFVSGSENRKNSIEYDENDDIYVPRVEYMRIYL